MIRDRKLHWVGCNNVRDLGGLSTLERRKTRWVAVIRSDDPSNLILKTTPTCKRSLPDRVGEISFFATVGLLVRVRVLAKGVPDEIIRRIEVM
jgi:hypothetical protein